MLELGCGGGSLAFHFKAQLQLTLTDRSAAMLEVSRAMNPECEHVLGDMRTLNLGREFDRVFLHDAVMYPTDRRPCARLSGRRIGTAGQGGSRCSFPIS